MSDSLNWTDTTPLRLSVAAERAFPDGGMTASGLRREAERGRLVIERIAGKDYVSFAEIAKMRELCRVPPKRRNHDASEAQRSAEAQARALAALDRLKSPPEAPGSGIARMMARRAKLIAAEKTK